MRSKRIMGFFLVIIGLLVSAGLFISLGKNGLAVFFHSDVFWVIGMPIICVGLALIVIPHKNITQPLLGVSGRIFLFLLLVIYFFASVFVVISEIAWKK